MGWNFSRYRHFSSFLFAWALGVFQPFSHSTQYDLIYRFAGGIEIGSPVRLSGIKVGKVEEIELPVEKVDVIVSEVFRMCVHLTNMH